MVDELLNVTRIQSGKLIMKPEILKVADIFAGQIALAKETTNRHNFAMDLEPQLPEVLADRDKFGAVIGNLVTNAVKYSPNGGTITLSARRDAQKNVVVIGVKDKGIGIGPEDRDSLFKTFHRIQRPETMSIRGSGLGLYIAKEWIKAMGGDIWLESELNKGSTFFISIPIAKKNK
jgi:signal transduction histidine kinase